MPEESTRTQTFTVSGEAPAAARKAHTGEAPGAAGPSGASAGAAGPQARVRQSLVGRPYAEQQRLLKPGPLPRGAGGPASAGPAAARATAPAAASAKSRSADTLPAAPTAGRAPGRAAGGRRRGPAGVRVGRVRRIRQNVTGSTLDELAAQLDPEEMGLCEWIWDYNAAYNDEGNASRVTVMLTLRITTPRWRGRGRQRASDAARTEWDRCMGALDTHENGHADLARQWAPRLREALLGQPEADLPVLWDQAKADHEQAQADYDATTNHGATQGAVLDVNAEPAAPGARAPAPRPTADDDAAAAAAGDVGSD